MFAAERQKIIQKYLIANGQLEVTSISGMLGVSEVTIRRDLERLEKDGFLIRTHGGALLNRKAPEFFPEEEKSSSPHDGEIVQTVLSLIKQNDVILLSGGALTCQIAQKLETLKVPLTVLTNSLQAALSLEKCRRIKTVILGGQLSGDDHSVYGGLAQSNMKRFYVNKLFFEADALSRDFIFTLSSTEKAEFIQSAMSIAQERILLCPSDRLNQVAFYRGGDLSQVTAIVTDSEMEDFYKESIFEKNIRLYTSVDLYEFHPGIQDA